MENNKGGDGCFQGSAVFITGVSSGIGHSLAKELLRRGCRVYGASRREPDDLVADDRFHFVAADLRDEGAIAPAVRSLLQGVEKVDLAVLNAGVLGRFADMAEQSLDDLRDVMNVNLWANKLLLDALFETVPNIEQVVAISSGAAVNGNRGWGGYSISKAALNMLTRLYSRERPKTHFCALAPGIVDTAMQEEICGKDADPRYPSLARLKEKRGTPDMPPPDAAAADLLAAMAKAREAVQSGDFADIRQPPLG